MQKHNAMAASEDALTTSDVAKYLGVSLTSVQKMVDRGELEAWTTPGGHRRIARWSVQKYLDAQTVGAAPKLESSARALRVLLAEDDPIQVRFFQTIIDRCVHVTELIVATDASTALIQLERHRPDIVVTDLMMQPFDGFHLIKVMQTDPAYYALDVIAFSSMSRAEAMEKGDLPAWVPFYQKPIHPERFLGYLDSMHTRVFKKEGVR